MEFLKINNSKSAAIYRKNVPWKNPGAKFYDRLMDSYYYVNINDNDTERMINDPRNLSPLNFLKEAYFIAPVNKIKNTPYGRTPYSRSGCKYPHHEIKGDELVVNINALKAAYSRARQMKVFKGELKDHFMRHIKELGIEDEFNIAKDELIEENFNWIESFLYAVEATEDDMMYMSESTTDKDGDEQVPVEDAQESNEDKKEESPPKQTDAREKNANGVKRKQLYMEFIDYAKGIHSNNLFGSIFDKDAFRLYNFIPHEMRYFYRLANPLLCVLNDSLTFFAMSELKKINAENPDINRLLIFAADKSNKLIIFNNQDKKVYDGESKDKKVICSHKLADSFDKYIESLVGTSILEESFIFEYYDQINEY
jgi:hypothetical protein